MTNEVVFTINGQQLDRVGEFNYLGRLMLWNNSDWPAMYRNIKKARQQWGKIVRVLKQEGATVRAFGRFYTAIVQSVLLYGVETWTIMDSMLQILTGFHQRAARSIANKRPSLVAGV